MTDPAAAEPGERPLIGPQRLSWQPIAARDRDTRVTRDTLVLQNTENHTLLDKNGV